MKKYLFFVFVLLGLVGCQKVEGTTQEVSENSFQENKVVGERLPLEGKVIIIDPGHGAEDPGSSANGLVEKELNMIISSYTKAYLDQLGATVFLTRSGDENPSLDDRALFSIQYFADIFVSIHHNANEASYVKGTEVYYNEIPFEGDQNPFPEESKRLAQYIFDQLTKYGDLNPLGVKEDFFLVLRKNTAPSVLVEVAYLTNPEDASILKDETNLKEFARRIAQGIYDYFEWKNKEMKGNKEFHSSQS